MGNHRHKHDLGIVPENPKEIQHPDTRNNNTESQPNPSTPSECHYVLDPNGRHAIQSPSHTEQEERNSDQCSAKREPTPLRVVTGAI